jgi:LysR family transcriptional regulator for bpeEF and oprC
MDKLRAIEYFVRVVDAGSFAAAARQMEVSPPAVTKMIAALERELGTTLLRRDSRRILLTPDGDRYLQTCTRTIADLRSVEAGFAASRARARGSLTVGVSRTITVSSLMPRFVAFHERHPELELDLRNVNYAHEPLAGLCDVLVLIGWQEDGDWIAHQIARGRHSVMAAPAFWKLHGIPSDPNDLPRLPALAYRVPRGVVIDRWKFVRGTEVRQVATNPKMIFDDRDAQAEAASRGLGMLFGNDLTLLPWIESGALQPVMLDWVGLEAPPIHLMYRRGGRDSARIRAFGEFVTTTFADIMQRRQAWGAPDTSPMPEWFRSRYSGRLVGRWSEKSEAGKATPPK